MEMYIERMEVKDKCRARNKFLKTLWKEKSVFTLLFLLCTHKSGVTGLSPANATTSRMSQIGESVKSFKICAQNNPPLVLFGDNIEIPTFSGDSLQYEYGLRKYKVDMGNPMVSCPNGEKLIAHHLKMQTKADFDLMHADGKRDPAILFKIFRSQPLLLDNGYLSVGNKTTKTATYYSFNEFCINAIKGSGIHTSVEFRTCSFSKTRPVLYKCCPLGMMRTYDGCVRNNSTTKWDPGYMDAKTKTFLTIDQVNPVYMLPLLPEESAAWESDDCELVFHPVTDNTLAAIEAARTWTFFNYSEIWCFDSSYSDGRQRLMIVQSIDIPHIPPDSRQVMNEKMQSIFYMITMYIGALFHFITSLVHLVTWKKQNIHGRTVCSCTIALFFMQWFYGTGHLLGFIRIGKIKCMLNGIAHQYFMIAAFTWLLIVNFDMWRTFGVSRMEGGGSLKRFLLFSLVGWLFPLLVSVISISMDFSFKCAASLVPVPDFGKHFCLVAPWAQGLYLYYILSVIMALVFVLAVLTLVGVYTVKKGAVNLRSTKRASDQQRKLIPALSGSVLLYLKLSVVMGLTWVFEVISWAVAKEDGKHLGLGWNIIDLYNFLSAIFIFVIFVCKTTTLSLLEQSVPALKGITDAFSKLVSLFSGKCSCLNDDKDTNSEKENGGAIQTITYGSIIVRYSKRNENKTPNNIHSRKVSVE